MTGGFARYTKIGSCEEKQLKLGILTRFFVAALALGTITGSVGCGGGSESEPPSTLVPVTRQYEGTWSGGYNSPSMIARVSYPMEFTVTQGGKVTGTLNGSESYEPLMSLDGNMIGDNSFAGTLTRRYSGGVAAIVSSRTDISGTLRLENGRIVGEYRQLGSPTAITSFRLEKK